ncbi:hypothetical protein ACFQFC_18125 [Amorphoplanes digitatis]|uniref:Lipoprotein n=1 Tax=Actinoplanes digitatis TaxID=1868 RepID=A0A7W7MTT7_9ACTN|nr:hypothetical protein [Actinoplanes digitatis]MBB4766132.1 hypothetical protein [Actinoplanes digitatis]BFE76137.1 hypothetical protein GCM10020092_094380 [Actinoplanes digitatis]GID96557.1 hypothetical protein Adi01nite_59690 [Actinoplanes digitatis]
MRRTLAVALAAAVLLTGGCARHPAATESAPTQRPPVDAPASPSPRGTTGASATTSSAKSNADVGGLLDEIDRQLHGDDQPAQDQD